MAYDVKFAHGKKANVNAALAAGKINEDDFIIFSDTDDELGFVNHNGEIKRIKARTNEDFVLDGVSLGGLSSGDVIPAGTSIDDLLRLVCTKSGGETPGEETIEVVESFIRTGSFPLDATEVQDNMDSAEEYIASDSAYPGQTIKVYDEETGEYVPYIIQKNEDGTKTLQQIATTNDIEEAISKIIGITPEELSALKEAAE